MVNSNIMYPSIYQSAYPSINLSMYLSIHLSMYPSTHLSIYLCIYLCIRLSIHPLTCCSVAKSSYSQVDLTSLACPGPVALTHLHSLPGQFLNEFDDVWVSGGSFGVQRWMPEATLKDHGSSRAKCSENVAKIAARGCLWEDTGALKGDLGRPWAQFARHFGGCGWYF